MAILVSRRVTGWAGWRVSQDFSSLETNEEREELPFMTLEVRAEGTEKGKYTLRIPVKGHLNNGFARHKALLENVASGTKLPLMVQEQDDEGITAPSAPACLIVPSVCLKGTNTGGESMKLLEFDGEFYADGVVAYRGDILYSSVKSGVVTADGATAAILTGTTAATDTRIYCVMMFDVPASTGDDLTVTIESDDDAGFPTPLTRATFGPIPSGTPFAATFAVVGAIADTHHRAVWAGAGSTPSYPMFVGTATAPT